MAPLPANQDALVMAVDKDYVTSTQVKAFCGVDIAESEQRVTIRRKYNIRLRKTSDDNLIKQAVAHAIRKRMGQLYE